MSLPSFIFGQGTPYKTPEQLQEARRRVRDLMSGGPEQYSRPGGWLYALSDGLGAALEQRKISQGEQYADEQRQKGSALFSQTMNGFGNAPAYPSSVAAGASPTSGIATGTNAPQAGTATVDLSSDKQKFIDTLLPAAIEHGQRIGVDPRIIVAQAAQETGWGRSAPGNNFFGIKSHGQGGGQNLTTHEVINGQRVKINDSFRTFASPQDSVAGYADFIASNKRYRPMREAQGLDAQLQALGASGYATDPNYARSVGAIARSINLPQQAQQGVQVASLDPSAGLEQAYAPQQQSNSAAAAINMVAPQSPYPEQGKVAPHDFTANPQLSTGAGMQFQGGQPQQMAALLPQTTPQSPAGPSAELLHQNDIAFGGALAPQGSAPVQVADASGYFPPAPSMDRAPVQQQSVPQNNNRLQMLGEVLSNPFVPEEQKRIAQMMFQQEMQQGQAMRQQQAARENWLFQQQYEEQVNARDPLRQAQIAKLQREAANPKGDETYFGNPVAVQNADGTISYGQIGNKGSFKPIQLEDGQTFAPPTKTLDTGTEIILTDQAGNVISRTPKQNYQAENDKARGASDGKNASEALAALPGTESFASSIDKQIDDLKNDPYLDKMLGWNDWLPNVYPEAKRVQSKIDQLKGGAFIAARDWLKGQGPITDFESARAEAAYARLNTAQSPEDFRLALEDFRNAVKSGADKVRARVKATGGQLQSAPISTPQPAAGGGSTRSGLKWSIEP